MPRVGVTHGTILGTHRGHLRPMWASSVCRLEGGSAGPCLLAFLVEAEPGSCVFWKRCVWGEVEQWSRGLLALRSGSEEIQGEGESVPHAYQTKERNNSSPLMDAADRKQLLKGQRAMWGQSGTSLLWGWEV